jgi:hypothetical protein
MKESYVGESSISIYLKLRILVIYHSCFKTSISVAWLALHRDIYLQ